MRVSPKSFGQVIARILALLLLSISIPLIQVGAPANAIAGEPTSGYRFGTPGSNNDSADGYLVMGSGFHPASDKYFTAEAWVYSADYTLDNAVVLLGAFEDNAFPNQRAISIKSGSSTRWRLDISGYSSMDFTVPTMTNGTWHYVAVSGDDNGIRLWLDGNKSTSVSCNSQCTAIGDNYRFNSDFTGTSTIIGGWPAGGGYYSSGGVVSSLRLSTEAVYSTTSSTMAVPTSPLTALATTKLLLNNPITDNTFTDSSNFRQNLTKIGQVSGYATSVEATKVAIEYLVVGGGGAGGLCGGGGGGAGGVKIGTTTISSAANSSYTIKVGGGGTSFRGADTGACGTTGVIKMGLGSTIETAASVTLASALGGGDGGYGGRGHPNRGTGIAEASGCGTMLPDAQIANGGGSGRNGCDTAGGAAPGGFSGSRQSLDQESAGAGGGAGGSPIRDRAINKVLLSGNCDAVPGGVGVSASLTGSAVTYGTGGTGGSWCDIRQDAADAADFTGNGGTGGAPYQSGGDGGSGIVVIRYASASKLFSGGVETTSGGYQIHTFKKSVDVYTQETFTLATVTPATLNFMSDGQLVHSETFVIGNAVTNWPSNPVKSGYAFNGWLPTGRNSPVTFSGSYYPVLTSTNQLPNGANDIDDGHYVFAGAWSPTTQYDSTYSNSHFTSSTFATYSNGINYMAIRPSTNILFNGVPDGYYMVPMNTTATLTASWTQISDTVTFNGQNNSASSTSSVLRGASATAPSVPTWYGYNFKGWSETTNGVVRDLSTVAINSAKTFYAIWEQKSIAGFTPAQLGSPDTIAPHATLDKTISSTSGNTNTVVKVPAGALPATYSVKVYTLADNSYAQQTLGANNSYIISQVVAWSHATDGTIQDTAVGKPIEMTITSPDIKTGAKVYSILDNVSTLLATATQDGSVRVSFTVDPVIVVEAAPVVPASSGGGAGTVTSTPSKPPIASLAKSFNILGFNPGSWSLTKSIKKSIDAFFKSITQPNKITCVGYTSGPTILKADARLAVRRGQEVCRYIGAKNPTIAHVITKGTNTRISSDYYRRTKVTVTN